MRSFAVSQAQKEADFNSTLKSGDRSPHSKELSPPDRQVENRYNPFLGRRPVRNEEVTFFLRNCPGVKMDGNNDGVALRTAVVPQVFTS